jgi:hypothetical protein
MFGLVTKKQIKLNSNLIQILIRNFLMSACKKLSFFNTTMGAKNSINARDCSSWYALVLNLSGIKLSAWLPSCSLETFSKTFEMRCCSG